MTDPYYPEQYQPQPPPAYPLAPPGELGGFYPPPPPPPAMGRRRGPFIVSVMAALIVGLGAGFAIGHFVGNDSADKASGSPLGSPDSASGFEAAGPTQLHVIGTFTLTDVTGYSGNRHCHGVSGYDDISAGTDVVITADSGRTLAITGLRGGHVSDEGCEFTFSARVPAGLHFYGVTISHRGTVKERAADLSNVQLTLG